MHCIFVTLQVVFLGFDDLAVDGLPQKGNQRCKECFQIVKLWEKTTHGVQLGWICQVIGEVEHSCWIGDKLKYCLILHDFRDRQILLFTRAVNINEGMFSFQLQIWWSNCFSASSRKHESKGNIHTYRSVCIGLSRICSKPAHDILYIDTFCSSFSLLLKRVLCDLTFSLLIRWQSIISEDLVKPMSSNSMKQTSTINFAMHPSRLFVAGAL